MTHAINRTLYYQGRPIDVFSLITPLRDVSVWPASMYATHSVVTWQSTTDWPASHKSEQWTHIS